jgi:hypothetical protein
MSVRVTLHVRQADYLQLVPYRIIDYYGYTQHDDTS